MNFFIVEQVPVPTPEMISADCPWDTAHTFGSWISTRASELTYTSYSLSGLAEECGWGDAPFVYDMHRRFHISAELNAGIFHLYALGRDEVVAVLDNFTVLAGEESKQWGDYRSKRLILEMFDAMQTAIDSGRPYCCPINPQSGSGLRHPLKELA